MIQATGYNNADVWCGSDPLAAARTLYFPGELLGLVRRLACAQLRRGASDLGVSTSSPISLVQRGTPLSKPMVNQHRELIRATTAAMR